MADPTEVLRGRWEARTAVVGAWVDFRAANHAVLEAMSGFEEMDHAIARLAVAPDFTDTERELDELLDIEAPSDSGRQSEEVGS